MMDGPSSLSCCSVLSFFLMASISASLIACMYNSNLTSWIAYPTFKANDFKVASWKCVLKLLAICRRQYLWNTRTHPSSSLGQFAIAFWIPLCRSEITQMFLSAITSPSEFLTRSKNHPQLGPDSLSTTAKEEAKPCCWHRWPLQSTTPLDIYHTNRSHQYWSLAYNVWILQRIERKSKIHSAILNHWTRP